MSDENNDTEAQSEPRNPTQQHPAHMAEPAELVPLDGPPLAARAEVLPEVTHVRIGGSAGVRVQQLGAAGVTRVGPGQDVFDAFIRVRRDTIVALRSAADAAESLDELRALVRQLMADTFDQLA